METKDTKVKEAKHEVEQAPSQIYCLACRKHQDCVEVTRQETQFDSRKTKKPMTRYTWVGKCKVCGKEVRRFSKGDHHEEKEKTEVPEEKTKA